MLAMLMVDADASPAGDGQSWATAYDDLQDALARAASLNQDAEPANDVDAIWLAEGVYTPATLPTGGDPRSASFSLVDGVTLYGGFDGTETALGDRDWAAHVTTLSGDLGTVGEPSDNAYTVILCDADIEAALDGVTISGGNADRPDYHSHSPTAFGGGVYSLGSLTVRNSTLEDNSAFDGGGGAIYARGVLTVVDSTIADNTSARGFGGGIYSTYGVFTVANSKFAGNWANGGGGIESSQGTLTVTDSVFINNSAGDAGGGGISSGSALTVMSSIFLSNSTSGRGGGIESGTDQTITHCTFASNSARDGGGIYSHAGTLSLTNSTLGGNSAENLGGGIYKQWHALAITNSTIAGNSADNAGGGVYSHESSTANLHNTIVAENVAASGPDISTASTALSAQHSMVGNGSGQTVLVDGVDGNQVGSSSSPINPQLSDLSRFANEHWGYYLLPGSPAVDAGSDALAVDGGGQPLVEDLAGSARIQGDAVDIGAVEGTAAASAGQSYTVTSLDDAIAADGVLTFAEAFQAANQNQPMGDAVAGSFTEQDSIYFAAGLRGTIQLEDGQLAIGGDLNVVGPGAELLAFDAQGRSRVFYISPNVVAGLSGLTIRGGQGHHGGGVYNDGSLALADAALVGNSVTVTWDTITGDFASDGGGIHNDGSLTIRNSTLAENMAGNGGGIFNNGEMMITSSVLSGNSAGRGNALGEGGGIFSDGVVTVTSSRVAGNSADRGGGLANGGELTLTNSTLSGNVAERGGGIVNTGSLAMTNATLSANSAEYGGGVYSDGSLEFANSIICLNSGSDIRGRFVAASSLMNANPRFVRAPSAGEDGLWGTADDDLGDLRLSDRSPAIDAGDNALAIDADGEPLDADLDGHPRILSGTVDMGAWEYQATPAAGRETPSLVVSSTADTLDLYDGTVTLRDAIYYPRAGIGDGTVQFDENLEGATITLGGSALPIIHPMSIDGSNLSALTLDGNGLSRVFTIANDAELVGLLITGGTAEAGGGIANLNGTLAVTDSTILGNAAYALGAGICNWDDLSLHNSVVSANEFTLPPGTMVSVDPLGGGIFNGGMMSVANATISGNFMYLGGGIANRGTMFVSQSFVTANSGGSAGGGIHNAGVLTVSETAISDNWTTVYTGGDGGGIFNEGELTVAGSTISGNATGNGGGLYNSGELDVTNSLIEDNSAIRYGGGMANRGGSLTVIGSTIAGNAVIGGQGSGGGIFTDGVLNVVNSTIAGNTAVSTDGDRGDGGGIWNQGSLAATNTTIVDNAAAGNGGGVYSHDWATLETLHNTIVAHNTAPSGPDIYDTDDTVSGTHNLIGNGSGQSALLDRIDSNQVGTDLATVDPQLSDMTRLENGQWSYLLLSGSPALDAGANHKALDPEGLPLAVDISGRARIQDGTVDIGALEGATPRKAARTYTGSPAWARRSVATVY